MVMIFTKIIFCLKYILINRIEILMEIYDIYTIYKNDTDFWDDFFIIPILSLKNNFHIKIDFQFVLVNSNIFYLLNN
jgi:hypothetical protein